MEKKSKEILRKHKKSRPASSSESSSSSDTDSGSSSDSYSSSSSEKKAMHRKSKKVRVRRSSSSTDEDRTRKRDKHACHRKLEAKKNHLKRKLKEAKAKKRGLSPSMRHRSGTPQKQKKIIPPIGSSAEKKHHQLILKERMLKEKEREREREKVRLGRERNSVRPVVKEPKSRSPSKVIRCRGELKRKSPMPVERHHQISPREKIIIQARRERSPNDRIKGPKDVRHRLDDRRERERAEAARQKEREEALARCQERQRERERIAREKLMRRDKEYDRDRLLPRPAEREMALAAARAANSRERSIEQPDSRRAGHSHGGHSSRQGRGDGGYDRAGGSYDRDREFSGHNDGHRSLERDDRRGGGGSNMNDIDRDYVIMRRRDVSSPPGNSGHYSDRQRGSDREAYPDDDRYDRDNYPPQRRHSRNYIQSNDDSSQHHRRGSDRGNGTGNNWNQQSHREHEDRGPEHRDKHFQEKLSSRGSDWKSNKNDWSDSPHWEEKNWQQRKKSVPIIQNDDNWEDEDSYNGPPLAKKKGDWNEPTSSNSGRSKHEHGRDDHGPSNAGSNQHDSSQQGSHHHGAGGRRWQQQEWRGRGPNETRQIHGSAPGQSGQGSFRHSAPIHPHPMDYNHDRPDYRRQQHSHHTTHLQHHHAGGYHHQPRPHFPSKRQMTYTNPNLLKAQQAAVAAAAAATAPVTNSRMSSPPATSGILSNAAHVDALPKIHTAPIIEVSPKPVDLQDIVIVATTIAATNDTISDILIEKNSEIISEIASPVNSEPTPTNEENEANTADTDIIMEDIITATSNPADESIPDDLSEISDEADEILNKDEDLSVSKFFVNDIETNEMGITDDFQSQENTKDDLINSEGGDTQGEPSDKDINDDLLDFEEISDGELEEESRKNLGDALGVDWASLVKDTKVYCREPPEEHYTTAKQKWQPHRIILDVGISFKYAGEAFAKRILNDAKLKLEAEQALIPSSENNHNNILNDDGINSVKIKMEKDDIEDYEIPPSVTAIAQIKNEVAAFKESSHLYENHKLSGIACVQVATRRIKELRRNLVFQACGPNSRALSARRDLTLRRQLVGLPTTKIVTPHNVSARMKALALKAFKDAIAAQAN